jgi:hypothetical protein
VGQLDGRTWWAGSREHIISGRIGTFRKICVFFFSGGLAFVHDSLGADGDGGR